MELIIEYYSNRSTLIRMTKCDLCQINVGSQILLLIVGELK